MLRIDRERQELVRLASAPLADVDLTERHDLQNFIVRSPEAFFAELGETLFLVGSEVQPSRDVADRIDLLAIDSSGHSVIIELKRGNNKWQMFQAISYAAMIASWQPDDFLQYLAQTRDKDRLIRHLKDGPESLNRRQRIILVAEAFDYAVLIGAEWLAERHGVDIRCCQLSLAHDATGSAEYLVCSNIFPAPEIAEQALKRRVTASRPLRWPDWPSALSKVVNSAVAAFFQTELDAGREHYLRKRELWFRHGGIRRWNVHARTGWAYVWQRARFDGDIEFWRRQLSLPDEVKSVKRDRGLSFLLETSEDFVCFRETVEGSLVELVWSRIELSDTDESDEE